MFALMRKRLRGRGKDQCNKKTQQDNNSFHETKFFFRSRLYICRLASMLCSSVSPEAPLMVQATIIFLFRICLGGLINLLRIHNSIYQNNGTLLGSHQQKKRSLMKDILQLNVWKLTTFPLPGTFQCTVSGCCRVMRRRTREAFQVMTVLVSKQTLNVCSLKRLSALTIKSDQSDPD